MKITLLIGHPTRRGPVFIGVDASGGHHILWRDESLGRYQNAPQAIDDAAGGHCFAPSDGTDLGSLDISADIGDWVPAAQLL